ncbi:neuritin-like isoform X1 [Huso huso]|uniref:Neuritin-like isoform X1 n=1 Tax=Huso huso TaxID=61971 RepID=A0ABR0Y574_HUSHU
MEFNLKRISLLLLSILLSLLSVSCVAGGSPCDNIYSGFSSCLLRLGENMGQYVEQELRDSQEIDNVCAHWDEFHACGMAAISGCQLEVQSVWDSLRRESEKLNFQGNLYDLCRRREQANQDWLTGSAGQNRAALGLVLSVTVTLMLTYTGL